MKYHKIRNVDLNVCTCEQKIAYNLAFQTHINFRTERMYKAQTVEIYRKQIVYDFVKTCINTFMNEKKVNKSLEKYDIDSIFCALNAGAENYLKSGCPIFFNYEDLGKMFPAYYLNK